MLESVYVVAHGIVTAHLRDELPRVSATGAFYKKLPTYKKYRQAFEYFIDRFVGTNGTDFSGVDIRPRWFSGRMPTSAGLRRIRWDDDERMEWFYSPLEEHLATGLKQNWTLSAVMAGGYGPELVFAGVPLQVLTEVADREVFSIGRNAMKLSPREIGIGVNVTTARKAIVDKGYRDKLLDFCVGVIQETAKLYQSFVDDGKDPMRCKAFSPLWDSRWNNRVDFDPDNSTEAIIPGIGVNDGRMDLTTLDDKELQILDQLGGGDAVRGEIRAEIKRRGLASATVKVRGYRQR